MGDLPARRPGVLIVSRRTALAELMLPMHLRGHVAIVVDDAGRPVGTIAEESLARATRVAQLGWTPRRSPDQSSAGYGQ